MGNIFKHSYEGLARKFVYDPVSGIIFRKLKKSLKEVGCLNKKLGYKVVRVGGVLYYSHRLAWVLYYGHWPENTVDHIDGNRINNSIQNLRDATRMENNQNRKKQPSKSSTYKGVTWCKAKSLWKVQIRFEGKNIHLGYFIDEVDAAEAYNKSVTKFHKAFSVYNEVEK